MRYFWLIALAALAGGLTWGEDQPKRAADGDGSRQTSASVTLPPVLRPTEPGDDVVVTLPGAPAKATAVVAPAPAPSTIVRRTPPPADTERPILRRHRIGRAARGLARGGHFERGGQCDRGASAVPAAHTGPRAGSAGEWRHTCGRLNTLAQRTRTRSQRCSASTAPFSPAAPICWR